MATTVNPYKRLADVLGGHTRLIAEVISTSGDGTSTVELRNGKRFTARGPAFDPADKVWIVDGVIQSKAPDLPTYQASV